MVNDLANGSCFTAALCGDSYVLHLANACTQPSCHVQQRLSLLPNDDVCHCPTTTLSLHARACCCCCLTLSTAPHSQHLEEDNHGLREEVFRLQSENMQLSRWVGVMACFYGLGVRLFRSLLQSEN